MSFILSVLYQPLNAECHYAEYHYDECHYAECHYAECHYAECHYAECRSAEKSLVTTLEVTKFIADFVMN